jgi:hypothetical protein
MRKPLVDRDFYEKGEQMTVTSPEHTEAATEAIAGLLDANGYDADAPVTVDGENGKTFIRDPQGIVYELILRPAGVDLTAGEVAWGRFLY